MTDIDLSDLERGLHDLFEYAFVTNCKLDDAEVTPEERQTLGELDSLEVLENFKDLILELINFKKNHKNSDAAELNQRCEQFEKMLQKLEAEVRNHIRVEHQLKLHIETSQSKVDELEKSNEQANAKIKKLENKLLNLEKNPKQRHNENKPNNEKTLPKDLFIRKDTEDKITKLEEIAEKREKFIQKLESEFATTKSLLEEKSKECEKYKKEIIKLKEKEKEKSGDFRVINNIDYLKKRIEEKSIELGKVQIRVKDKTGEKSAFIKERGRNTRGSLGEIDLMRNASPDGLRKELTEPPLRHHDDKKGNGTIKRPRSSSRGHIRSASDHARPNSSKRAPSR
ncbi:unnamed protein product [Blepharisma stoltei]|uniref:Uncharacterized protein n=1 Tax=Blepharisma stoltei TaxID=1481888 RepID=A0AAU9ICP1_9CILI|nr:unnamed protein product [Blepharisma stoltei]